MYPFLHSQIIRGGGVFPDAVSIQELDAQNDSFTKEYDVSTSEAFTAAVNEINNAAGGSYAIRLQADITLSGDIRLEKNTTTILGEGYSLSGGSNQTLGAVGTAVLNLGSENYSQNLTFKGNNASHTCLSISDTATVNLYEGVTIQGYAPLGADGAVSMSGTSIFNMYGGIIENCKDVFSGTTGGVGVGSASDSSTDTCTFTMSGGVIRNCSGGYGGGVRIGKGGTFTMSDGEISNNTATWGGGIYATQAKKVEISGGKISGNGGTYGGGLSVTYMKDSLTSFFHRSVLLSGGEITGNTATYGGGISLYNSNTAQPIQNITVTGNTAQVGGGIMLWNNSDMNISASGNIICNNMATAGAADVFLNKSEDSITLPAAAGMNRDYQATGKKIDGWYKDDPRYTPGPDGTAVDVTGKLTGELALVASYKVVPSHKVTVNVTNGAAYDNAACTGTPITEAEEGSTVYLKYTGSDLFNTWNSDPADLTITDADKASGASFVMPDRDVTVTADISALYTVTLPGSVTDVTAAAGTVSGSTVSVPEGAKITFRKPADADVIYKLGDTELIPDENGVYTVTIGAGNITVTEEKVQKPEPKPEPTPKPEPESETYTLKVVGGSFTTGGSEAQTNGTVPVNAEVKVALNPDAVPEGMVFDQWRISEESLLGNPNVAYNAESFTIPANTVAKGTAVTVEAQYRDATIESEGPGILGTGAMIATVGIGAAALGYQAHMLGTEFALRCMMPDWAVIPQNRLELAVMMWNDAGTPEPVSTNLYSDISEEDSGVQKAARWAVENELMELPDADEHPENFAPFVPVSYLDSIHAWKKAQKLKK